MSERRNPDYSGLSSSRVFLDKEGTPFVYDRVTGKVYRISAERLHEITSPVRKFNIAVESSVISEQEASRMAREPRVPSRPR